MEIKAYTSKITDFLKKYRFALLVLALGLLLMLIPISEKEQQTNGIQTEQTMSDPTIEERLCTLLSQIKGAGNVKIMLTESTGEEISYQLNENGDTAENTSTYKKDTVIITDASRNQSGLIRQINPPGYLGAVVVCQGADDPSVQLAIVDAVSKLTGLGANKISVLKMK